MGNESATEASPKITIQAIDDAGVEKYVKDVLHDYWFHAATILLALVFLVWFFCLYYNGYKTETSNILSNFYLTIPLLGGVFGIVSVKKLRKPIRKTYLLSVTLFSCGLVLWSIGCGLYMIYNLYIDRNGTFYLPAEIVYLICFLLWTAGIIYLYECADKNVINDANSTITILLPLWGVIATFIYYLQVGNSNIGFLGENLVKFIFSILFPIIDLYNLGLLITLLPSAGNQNVHIKGKPLFFITFGYLFLCLASTSFTIRSSLPSDHQYQYHSGCFTDVMFAIAFAILNFGIYYVIKQEVTTPRSCST